MEIPDRKGCCWGVFLEEQFGHVRGSESVGLEPDQYRLAVDAAKIHGPRALRIERLEDRAREL